MTGIRKIFFSFFYLLLMIKGFSAAPGVGLWVAPKYSGLGKNLKFNLHLIDVSNTLCNTISSNSNNVFMGGMGSYNGNNNYYGTLWTLAGSTLRFKTPLNNIDGCRVSGSAVASNNNIYLVGPPDDSQFGDYVPTATLWICNSQGQLISTNSTLGAPNHSYAYGCSIGPDNKCYVSGYYNDPYLWICDLSGNIITTINLSSNSNTGASGCTTDSNFCYVVGQKKYTFESLSYFLSWIWKVNLQTNVVENFQLQQTPQTVDNTSYGVACAISGSKLYIVGAQSDGSSDQGCLWITDSGSPQIATPIVFNEILACDDIVIYENFGYIVGEDRLIIIDLEGKVLSSQTLPGCSKQSSLSITVFNDQIYISGLTTASPTSVIIKKLSNVSYTR